MITDDCLKIERPHLSGVQRLYEFGPRFGLSLINSDTLHIYPFAWEAAVLVDGFLSYKTPLTNDVEVFMTEQEADDFIARAKAYFATPEAAALEDNSNACREMLDRLKKMAEEIKAAK